MMFHELKFVLLRCGQYKDMKYEIKYFTYDMNEVIGMVDTYRDLGIQMSTRGDCMEHIKNMIKEVKNK